jgi:hypothetical protein
MSRAVMLPELYSLNSIIVVNLAISNLSTPL